MAERSPTSPDPVGCLRVFPPDTDPFDYPLTEGESSIGRGEDCDVTLSTGSLSRKHAMILVEQGSHFVMDLGSRNKTFRRMVPLKPNIYYELTDGVELTFANLTCHYLIPQPEGEEQTQDYGAEEVTKDEAEEESVGSTVCDPSEARVDGGEGGEDDEPTQAYDLDSPRSDGEGAPMDIEPTVAYDLQDLEESDKEEENDDSVASSPLLVGGPRLLVSKESPSKKIVSFTRVPDKSDEATPTTDNEATQENTDSETDDESPKPGPALERGLTEQMDTAPPIDPTVLYDLDTDTEENANADPTSSETISNKATTSSENEVTSSDKGATSSSSGVETRASDVEDTEPVVEPAATEPINDSDSTDIEEESPVKRKPMAVKKKGRVISSSEDEVSGTEEDKKPPLKPEVNEDCGTEEEKKPPLEPQPSTGGGLSLMDYSEQGPPTLGAGTLILPSYEESCDPEDGGRVPTLTKGTTVVMESYQSTCVPSEEETPVVKEDRSGGNSGTTSVTKDEAASDDEQPIPKVEASKQRIFALSSLSGRGKRGRAKKGTRGRKPNEHPKLDTEDTEDTEALLNFGREDSGPKDECKDPPPSTMAATLSVATMDVDSTLPATLKLDATITADPAPKGLKVKRGGSSKRGRGGRRQTSKSKTKASVVESHDLLDESPDLLATSPDGKALDGQSDSISEQSSKESTSSQSGRGRGRAKKEAIQAPSVRRTPTSSRKASATATETPRVMFTGLIDEEGQRSVQDLGGEMVNSVYQCTHLITDKVRRTVKFLCCLSRGCLIVSSNWLSKSVLAGQFLPAEPFLIKDRSSERQFNFSLIESHHIAKMCKVLEGYTVYLTANIKPQREQMADIIKCSGGEPLDYTPSVALGDKVIVVTCEEDLSLTSNACVAGVPVCSTELVLGGVLRQHVDIDSHKMEVSAATKGRKRVAKEPSTATVPAKRRRK